MQPICSFYELLGVSRAATAQEIKSAFHAAALQHHPDKVQCADSSAFVQLQRAWEVLRDTQLREMHDRELQLQDMRQSIMFMDELELEELEEGVHTGQEAYTYPCRCGDTYILRKQDLQALQQAVAVPCHSCSNYILINLPPAVQPDG